MADLVSWEGGRNDRRRDWRSSFFGRQSRPFCWRARPVHGRAMSPDSLGAGTDNGNGVAERFEASSPSLLMDLRPCYEGFAGIPQETRLLFAMFSGLRLRRFGGLASGIHYTSRRGPVSTPLERVFEQTKVLISQDTRRVHWPAGVERVLPNAIRRRLFRPYMALSELFRSEQLDLRLDSRAFEDFLWTKLFDNTLAPQDRPYPASRRVLRDRAGSRICAFAEPAARAVPAPGGHAGWDIFFGNHRLALPARPRHSDDDPLLRRPAAAQPAHDRRAMAARHGPCPHAAAQHARRRQLLLRLRAGARRRAQRVPRCRGGACTRSR